MRVMISACLLGAHCRYDGCGKANPVCVALLDSLELIPVCPEQLGGLPTPRSPAERSGDRVVAADGRDVTEAFAQGARETCRLAKLYGVKSAILKARSPSCGVGAVYDGTFTKTVARGDGVTAEALRGMGIALYTEEDIEELGGDCFDTL